MWIEVTPGVYDGKDDPECLRLAWMYQSSDAMLHYSNEADTLHMTCSIATVAFSDPDIRIGDEVQDAYDRQSVRLVPLVIAAFICWASGGADALKAPP